MREFLARAATVASVDLVRRYRNRSMVITAFVAPLVLAVLLGWIFHGVSHRSHAIGVVDDDGSVASRVVVDELIVQGTLDGAGSSTRGLIRFELVGDADEARAAVHDGDLSAAVVIPAGYGAGIDDGPVPILVLRSPRRAIGGQIAVAVASTITDRTLRSSVALRTATEVGVSDLTAVSLEAATMDDPLDIQQTDVDAGADVKAHFAASMCIVFLFFTVGFAARSVMIDRDNGMLARVLSTPTSVSAVITGKTVSVAALGAIGFLFVWVVTSTLFAARWGAPVPVVVLIMGTVTAITGLSLLVCSLGRTERQADAYATMTTFVLALLGGSFVPVGTAPAAFRRLSVLTPNGWALVGFGDVSAGASVGDVLLPVAVLSAIGVIGAAGGFVRLRRSVVR